MVAEAVGARTMTFVKDEDGLYTADPKRDRSAEFISAITAPELLARDLPDLIIERSVILDVPRSPTDREMRAA